MTNERFFRMLSIALLGAVALACVPDSQAESPYSTETTAIHISAAPIEVEISSLQEVEDINAGRFNPALAGEAQDYTVSSLETVR